MTDELDLDALERSREHSPHGQLTELERALIAELRARRAERDEWHRLYENEASEAAQLEDDCEAWRLNAERAEARIAAALEMKTHPESGSPRSTEFRSGYDHALRCVRHVLSGGEDA